jgi:hypothetical protein
VGLDTHEPATCVTACCERKALRPSASFETCSLVEDWEDLFLVHGMEATITTRQYEARDGSGKRYRTEIVARQIRLLGKRPEGVDGKADEVPF